MKNQDGSQAQGFPQEPICTMSNGQEVLGKRTSVTGEADAEYIPYRDRIDEFSPEDQAEILKLADSIDPSQKDKLLHFGDNIMQLIKKDAQADIQDNSALVSHQDVAESLKEMSNDVEGVQKKFDIIVANQQPSKIQRFAMIITRKDPIKQIVQAANDTYSMVQRLDEKAGEWKSKLQTAYTRISRSLDNQEQLAEYLDMYILAARIAVEKFEAEMMTLQFEKSYEQTKRMEILKSATNILKGKISVFENFRAGFHINKKQLMTIKETNEKIQTSIFAKKEAVLASISMGIRNAQLDAVNRQALAGQEALKGLNEQVLKSVSDSVGLTGVIATKESYAALCNVTVLQTAIDSLKSAYDTIGILTEQGKADMEAQSEQMRALLEQIEPKDPTLKGIQEYLK